MTSAHHAPGQPSRPEPPLLEGTFLQLLQQHADWPPSRWHDLFDYFHDLGLRQLIVQWSVLDDLAFYPSGQFQPVSTAPLEMVLGEADRLGLSVQLGLVHDSHYWTRITQDPATVASYFDHRRRQSIATARELVESVRQHRCITGWYLPEEIDDVNWHDRARREVLLRHLSTLSLDLRKLTPNLTISISTFAQGQLSPAGFEEFWNTLFQETKIDSVYFQDGVGVNKLEIGEVPLYLGALHTAAAKNQRQAHAIIELLQQISGPPINQAAFQAVPGPLERILRQIESARQVAPNGMMGFSVPEYMTPFGGKEAGLLFERYRASRTASVPSPPVVPRRADP